MGGASYTLSPAKWLASLIFDSAGGPTDLLGRLALHWAGRWFARLVLTRVSVSRMRRMVDRFGVRCS